MTVSFEFHRTPATASRDAWGGVGAVFENLAGDWVLKRRIPGIAGMQGKAHVVQLGTGHLRYVEQGCLKLKNGQSFHASRSYLFKALGDGFAVYYDQPLDRLFQEVRLTPLLGGHLTGMAEHCCPPDRYRSRYTFRSDGCFYITHCVTGPSKSYRSFSRFSRAGSDLGKQKPPPEG